MLAFFDKQDYYSGLTERQIKLEVSPCQFTVSRKVEDDGNGFCTCNVLFPPDVAYLDYCDKRRKVVSFCLQPLLLFMFCKQLLSCGANYLLLG